eukprot:15465310-Alexandrium_andersonii.AAC.1
MLFWMSPTTLRGAISSYSPFSRLSMAAFKTSMAFARAGSAATQPLQLAPVEHRPFLVAAFGVTVVANFLL